MKGSCFAASNHHAYPLALRLCLAPPDLSSLVRAQREIPALPCLLPSRLCFALSCFALELPAFFAFFSLLFEDGNTRLAEDDTSLPPPLLLLALFYFEEEDDEGLLGTMRACEGGSDFPVALPVSSSCFMASLATLSPGSRRCCLTLESLPSSGTQGATPLLCLVACGM